MQPTPMRSAGLKYADDGTVAWNEIWGSFCDLAMAGGPPHKGTLLEPGTPAEIAARPDRYQHVVDEICRGITMVTDLPARESPTPGWIRATCFSEPMAGWLVRAIATENVAVRADGHGAGAAGRAGISTREGNQERHHRHREDVSLLDGPHAARAATRRSRSCSRSSTPGRRSCRRPYSAGWRQARRRQAALCRHRAADSARYRTASFAASLRRLVGPGVRGCPRPRSG